MVRPIHPALHRLLKFFSIKGGITGQMKMEKIVELVFGYGRWSCMGKNVAYLEMDKVYFEVCILFP